MSNHKTLTQKAKRMAVDKECLKRYLSENNRIRQIIDNIEKLEDVTIPLDATDITRINAATTHRLALLRKYLPDEKSVEVKNADCEEFKTSSRVQIVFNPVSSND